MQKIEILFPGPAAIAQVRRLARIQDRLVSKIVQRTVEHLDTKKITEVVAIRQPPD